MLILQLHTVDPKLDIKKKLQDSVSRIHNLQLTKSLQNLQHTTQISAHIDLFIIQMYKNKIKLSYKGPRLVNGRQGKETLILILDPDP